MFVVVDRGECLKTRIPVSVGAPEELPEDSTDLEFGKSVRRMSGNSSCGRRIYQLPGDLSSTLYTSLANKTTVCDLGRNSFTLAGLWYIMTYAAAAVR